MLTTKKASGTAPAPDRTALGKPRMRGWLHVVAFGVVVVVGPFLVSNGHSSLQRLALCVYVLSLLTLFGVSALFHRGHWSQRAARRMRRADHASIFFAIAGTYTAVASVALAGTPRLVVLGLVWGGSLVGVLLRQLFLDAPKWVVALPYVVVGWSAIAVSPELVRGASWPGFVLVLLGGLVYTVGAVVYARKKPDPVPSVFGFHEVFHSCTVIGAALQFLAIAYFALPRN
ncbi:MAG: PAQR family membrane homeostasis protein TrhA [Acidimicrobiales bacterium]